MRRGLGKGQGRGYYNLAVRDPLIHSLSSRGIKTYAKYLPISSFKKELKREKIESYELPIQTAIIVPSTKEKNKLVTDEEYKERIKEVHNELYDMFEGFTSVQAIGQVEDEETKLPIEEPVSVVVSYADKEKFEEHKKEFIKFVENKKKEWGQQSMGVIIENELFFI